MPPLPPPPKAAPPKANGAPARPARPMGVSRGIVPCGHKIVVYGPGGVGKSKLCSLLSQVGINPLFLDVEDSCKFLDVDRIDPTPATWDEVRSVLQNRELIDQYGAVVVDSFTKAEEFATNWTIENIPHEKGKSYKIIKGIEDYGFGKGQSHVYETFLQVLSDLDAIARSGTHVICTAHDCTANVPNPGGEDWIRYEPRLQSPSSGRASIRHRVKEWCDHLLYVGFDVSVNEDGKADGQGTRTIYPCEMPTHWAKSRTLRDTIEYRDGSAALWKKLFNKE